MKSFKEIKSYDTITLNVSLKEINEYFEDKNEEELALFYIPLKEGVVKNYTTSANGHSLTMYTYFNNYEEKDNSIAIEHYMYIKDEYKFIPLLALDIYKFGEAKDKHEFNLMYFNEKEYVTKTHALKQSMSLINIFVLQMIYMIYLKEHRNTKYIIPQNNVTLQKKINNSDSKYKSKKKNVQIISDNKVAYSLAISNDNYKQFKKKYTRHTESWQVMGFARHYKSGKVSYVKPHIRGNKNKETSKKEYIVK